MGVIRSLTRGALSGAPARFATRRGSRSQPRGASGQPKRGGGPRGLSLLGLLLLGGLALGLAPWRRAPEPPRLLVWLVVDQGRADSASRLGDQLSDGGFRRFMEEGAWFTDAHFRHMATWTASGHATLATGAYAPRHGLMSNYWFEDGHVVKAADGRSVDDPSVGRPWASTLGDELHLARPGARVVSVSLKDRAAIILAGGHPDGMYWLDTAQGAFVGKGPQGGAAAPWVQAFNSSGALQAPFGAVWNTTLPEALRMGADSCPNETDAYGLGRAFPHTIDGGLTAPGPDYYKALLRSPQGTGLLLDFALEAVRAEGLGADDTPDLLYVSISTTDYAGHFYGLQSWELAELLADLDSRLGPFIDSLEAQVGKGRVGLVLSADHGGAPVPECVEGLVDGGRVGYTQVSSAVEDALIQRFGLRGGQTQAGSDGGWVVGFEAPGLYLDIPPGADAAAVKAVATRAIMAIDGTLDVCDVANPSGPYAEACRLSAARGREPTLMLVTRPYWIFSKEEYQAQGTTHGSPHAYDTGVLMGFWGPGVRRGVITQTADVAAAASTAAAWLGVPPPAAREVGAWPQVLQ